MNIDVSIARCPDYSEANCRRALEEVLAPLGGLDWVQPSMTVAVKANLVTFMKPDAAATTHPEALCALAPFLPQDQLNALFSRIAGGRKHD